jgi:hypothetical protein
MPHLKAAIRAQLEKLIRLNRTRLDFQDKFEALIESYNAGSRNIEDILDTGLPRVYSPELYQPKGSAVFQHVCESYPERDAGVYAAVGCWEHSWR